MKRQDQNLDGRIQTKPSSSETMSNLHSDGYKPGVINDITMKAGAPTTVMNILLVNVAPLFPQNKHFHFICANRSAKY